MQIKNQVFEHIRLANELIENSLDKVELISDVICKTLNSNNKILLFGNGGSAADAQHIAAEFTGRFLIERKGLAAIALTTDTSALTAIGNDYGFDRIFERQIEALAKPGDVLIGISTSGNSSNVVRGIELGNNLGCQTISLTGNDGGVLKEKSRYNLNINSNSTARIQEMHILIGHLICFKVDEQKIN